MNRHNVLNLLSGAILLAAATLHAAEVEPGFKSIFNGKNLAGWDGHAAVWSVKDGAITGKTTEENPIKKNTFLIWTNGTTEDFELRLSYRMEANNDKGFANSGIQYRSKVLDAATWSVGGYQADMEAGAKYSGILYDEGGVAGGRQIMAARGEKVVWGGDCLKQVTGSVGDSDEIQATIKTGDWNEYVIVAHGNRLQHFINGKLTVDVTDDCEAKRLRSGVLALQVHTGPPMTVQFKNIRIKTLAKSAAIQRDIETLQGNWAPSEMIVGGEPLTSEALAKIRLTVKGNEYFVETSDQPDQGEFEILAAGKPGKMDVTSRNGQKIPAIYELSGDTLKACYALNDSPRPAKFKSAAGSDHVFVIYKRVSP